MKDKIKIFIMTMVAFVATTFSTGIPESKDAWIVFGVTVLGIAITYIAKNFLIPSTSEAKTLNWVDLISGALIAIGAAISSFVAEIAVGGSLDWKELGKLLFVVVMGYLSKTLIQQPATEPSNQTP